jgi:hypothetical protein
MEDRLAGPARSTRADFRYVVRNEGKRHPPAGPGRRPAAPTHSTTYYRSSTSAAGGHARLPGRESRPLRPDRRGGRDSETPALAERRGLPPVPPLSFRMRAMTQPTQPLPRPRRGTSSQGRNAFPRTSAQHRQAPTKLPARIGPPASLLEAIGDAIADCGPVHGRCLPRENPCRPSLEFQGPDCANGRRVVHRGRVEAGQQPGGEVGTILVPQCQSVPQDRFGLGGHDPIVRAAGAKARAPFTAPEGLHRSCQFAVQTDRSRSPLRRTPALMP